MKFNVDQINTNIETGKTVVVPSDKTVVIPAQGDTGANVSATNIVSITHNYFEYDVSVKVGVFLEKKTKEGCNAPSIRTRYNENNLPSRICHEVVYFI